MRSVSTKPWANATLSIYGATVDSEPAIQLDNVTLRTTPASVTAGTDCIEPGGGSLESAPVRREPVSVAAPPVAPRKVLAQAVLLAVEAASRGVVRVSVTLPPLERDLLAMAGVSLVAIEVSEDGLTWQVVAWVPAGESITMDVDQADLMGRYAHVRVTSR
jgi:hypothetical protein